MLYNDDCINVLSTLQEASVDMIFADPPYFLSNNGKSISSGKVVSVNKGDWDKKENYSDILLFTKRWMQGCYRVLKNTGTIWVSGTKHNIFDVKRVMDEIGFSIINIIIWKKIDPPPLIYKNKYRFSYEFIIWAKKGKYHYFNYDAMYKVDNNEMHDVWFLPSVSMSEKKYGRHPTQKPECLLERIIIASTKEGDVVLDPFMGSGTTCVVAKRLNRKWIGIDKEREFCAIAKLRLANIL
ncbi:MAG: site-specific DNA-methyltransferase [Bacilli bacterium]|nr:site-specific DNA-methyltransferase [Bacilli bacterium]